MMGRHVASIRIESAETSADLCWLLDVGLAPLCDAKEFILNSLGRLTQERDGVNVVKALQCLTGL